MVVYVAVFALVLAYLAVLGTYFALRALARLRRVTALLSGGADTGGQTVVDLTEAHVAQTRAVAEQLAVLQGQLDTTQRELAEATAHRSGPAERDAALRNVALVRYDAFDDMAGRLSFSLALLDDHGDGVALTAISGRSDTRMYAKAVAAGKGEHDLSPEERQAVKAALRPPATARRAS